LINRTVLVGRLTKDPELRYTPNGVAVCTFTLAVNRPFLEPKRVSDIQDKGTKTQTQQSSTGLAPEEDPFYNSGEPIDISDDDLPF